MKKVILVVIFILVLGGGIAGTAVFYSKWDSSSTEADSLKQQVLQLQQQQSAIGDLATVYTVAANVTSGLQIRAEDLVEMSALASSLTDVVVMDPNSIIGKFWKVNIVPGTTITTDLVMEDIIEGAAYERDIVLEQLPLGIGIGDYIDLRIVLPYGEEFVIMTRKRVEQVVLEAKAIKVIMTEPELALWTSACRDKALYNEKGISIYATVYTEPGLMYNSSRFYPVRKEMEGVVTLNPNITNKAVCINAPLRDAIELMLQAVSEKDADLLEKGTTAEEERYDLATDVDKKRKDTIASGEVITDYQAILDEAGKNILQDSIVGQIGTGTGDGTSGGVTGTTPADGITQGQEAAAGDPTIYEGESPIE